ncbi:MAG: nucleotidyltransferase domain-containing protein, partial [Pseudomonadota bacterium]
ARLRKFFGSDIDEINVFGSYSRGTILPRELDEASDVDILVVFNSDGSSNQTYLNRLKRFAEFYYSSSTIKQSFPTVVLELNHIKFDLVPAYRNFLGRLQIPDKSGDWQSTYPFYFNSQLTELNKNKLSNIKPAIRLCKIWNSSRGHVYESFELETKIVENCRAFSYSITDLFLDVFDEISIFDFHTEWRRNEVRRAKEIASEVRYKVENDWLHLAEDEVKKLV